MSWLTVEAAASALGVSERTVWRRVKAGALRIDRSVTPHLVEVSDSGVPESAKVSELLHLEAEVIRLEAEVIRLEDLLSEVRSERDYLRGAHAASLAQSQRLLEHVEVESEDRRPERFREWLWRVLGRRDG